MNFSENIKDLGLLRKEEKKRKGDRHLFINTKESKIILKFPTLQP